jgi:hypothetical protein
MATAAYKVLEKAALPELEEIQFDKENIEINSEKIRTGKGSEILYDDEKLILYFM